MSAIAVETLAHALEKLFSGLTVLTAQEDGIEERPLKNCRGSVLAQSVAIEAELLSQLGFSAEHQLPAGLWLTPVHTGLAAALGLPTLPVWRPLKVSVFFSGEDLTEPGEVLHADRRYNSHRYWLRGALVAMGCEVRDLGVVPESVAATRLALSNAAENSDLIITCGGVEEDYVQQAITREGVLQQAQIAMSGLPVLSWGKVASADFIGLPNAMLPAYLLFLLAVAPALQRIRGLDCARYASPCYRLPLTTELAAQEYEQVLPVQVIKNEQQQAIAVQLSPAAPHLWSCLQSQGLIRAPAGQAVAAGETVAFYTFERLL